MNDLSIIRGYVPSDPKAALPEMQEPERPAPEPPRHPHPVRFDRVESQLPGWPFARKGKAESRPAPSAPPAQTAAPAGTVSAAEQLARQTARLEKQAAQTNRESILPTAQEAARQEHLNLQEKLQEAREKARQRRESLTPKTNGSQYGDVAMTAYAQLARARTQGQVSSAAGYARRQIARLQSALHSDSDNSERIKAAIRQLQKAVGRAGKKKRELQREDLLRARQRKAQQAQQLRKAEALRQERESRRTQRSIREQGYLREVEIDNRLQSQLAQTRMELRQQAEALSAGVGASVQTAAQSYAGAAAGAPVVGAALDVEG